LQDAEFFFNVSAAGNIMLQNVNKITENATTVNVFIFRQVT